MWPLSAILVTVISSTSLIVLAVVLVVYIRTTRQGGAVQSDSIQMKTVALNKNGVDERTEMLYENVGKECQLLEQAEEAGCQKQGEDTLYSFIPELSYEALAPRPEQLITSEPYQDLRQWSDMHQK